MYIIPYWYNQSSRRENERSGHLSGIDLISASSILITSNKWNHTPNIPTCNAGATKISICLHFRTAMASRQQLTSIVVQRNVKSSVSVNHMRYMIPITGVNCGKPWEKKFLLILKIKANLYEMKLHQERWWHSCILTKLLLSLQTLFQM